MTSVTKDTRLFLLFCSEFIVTSLTQDAESIMAFFQIDNDKCHLNMQDQLFCYSKLMAIAVTQNAGSIVLLLKINSNKCHSILLLGFVWIISTPYSVCSSSSGVVTVSPMSVVTLCVGSSIGGVLRGASLQLALKIWV